MSNFWRILSAIYPFALIMGGWAWIATALLADDDVTRREAFTLAMLSLVLFNQERGGK